MRVRFAIADVDYPDNPELDESNVRQIDVIPRKDEIVHICPDGEERAQPFIVSRVTHYPDLNTVVVGLNVVPWTHALPRIVAEGDEDVTTEEEADEG